MPAGASDSHLWRSRQGFSLCSFLPHRQHYQHLSGTRHVLLRNQNLGDRTEDRRQPKLRGRRSRYRELNARVLERRLRQEPHRSRPGGRPARWKLLLAVRGQGAGGLLLRVGGAQVFVRIHRDIVHANLVVQVRARRPA